MDVRSRAASPLHESRGGHRRPHPVGGERAGERRHEGRGRERRHPRRFRAHGGTAPRHRRGTGTSRTGRLGGRRRRYRRRHETPGPRPVHQACPADGTGAHNRHGGVQIPRPPDARRRAAAEETVEREGTFALARMGIDMAAPAVAAEERKKLTEWIAVVVFSVVLCEKLQRQGRAARRDGQPHVSAQPDAAGEKRVERDDQPNAIMSATVSSIPPRGDAGPAGGEIGLGDRRPDATTHRRGRKRGSTGTQPMATKQAATGTDDPEHRQVTTGRAGSTLAEATLVQHDLATGPHALVGDRVHRSRGPAMRWAAASGRSVAARDVWACAVGGCHEAQPLDPLPFAEPAGTGEPRPRPSVQRASRNRRGKDHGGGTDRGENRQRHPVEEPRTPAGHTFARFREQVPVAAQGAGPGKRAGQGPFPTTTPRPRSMVDAGRRSESGPGSRLFRPRRPSATRRRKPSLEGPPCQVVVVERASCGRRRRATVLVGGRNRLRGPGNGRVRPSRT